MGVLRAVAAVLSFGALCALADEANRDILTDNKKAKKEAISGSSQEGESPILDDVVAVSIAQLLKFLQEVVGESQVDSTPESLEPGVSSGDLADSSTGALALLENLIETQDDLEPPPQKHQGSTSEQEELEASTYDHIFEGFEPTEESEFSEASKSGATEAEVAGTNPVVSDITSDTANSESIATENFEHYYPSSSGEEHTTHPVNSVVGSASMQTAKRSATKHQEDEEVPQSQALRGSSESSASVTTVLKQTSGSAKRTANKDDEEENQDMIDTEELDEKNLGTKNEQITHQIMSGISGSSGVAPTLSSFATVLITFLSVATAGAVAAF